MCKLDILKFFGLTVRLSPPFAPLFALLQVGDGLREQNREGNRSHVARPHVSASCVRVSRLTLITALLSLAPSSLA